MITKINLDEVTLFCKKILVASKKFERIPLINTNTKVDSTRMCNFTDVLAFMGCAATISA